MQACDVRVCLACGGTALTSLPAPSDFVSIVSDGRVRHAPLRKVSCESCGLVSHAVAPTPELIAGFYDDSYDLGLTTGGSELGRARAYAAVVVAAAEGTEPVRILEAGCGGGVLLERLAAHWPRSTCVGLEASPALARIHASRDDRVRIEHGFLETRPAAPIFDLVVAINVIEHALDPVRFVSCIAANLAPRGRALIVCPAARPANLELLFADHLHTFTPAAMSAILDRQPAGLTMRQAPVGPPGDFQAFLLERTPARGDIDRSPSSTANGGGVAGLAAERARYIAAWQSLDLRLRELSPPSERLVAFGAGESAALLRAYAPATWTRLECLVVDPGEAPRDLGKPVHTYPDGLAGMEAAVLLATHPRGQAGLARRLEGDGRRVLRWDHVVPQ